MPNKPLLCESKKPPGLLGRSPSATFAAPSAPVRDAHRRPVPPRLTARYLCRLVNSGRLQHRGGAAAACLPGGGGHRHCTNRPGSILINGRPAISRYPKPVPKPYRNGDRHKSGISQKRFYRSLIRKADERFAEHLGIDEAGMVEIEAEIAANPTHPMVRGPKGARKARIQRSGMGKRGGGRVIYYVALGTGSFYMMAAYPKSERDDLSTEQRRRILTALESIKRPGR
jgi:hypothetical protein